MVKVREDLTGNKFGKLTVLKQTEDYVTKKNQHYSNWICQCDCGSEPKTYTGNNLKNGKVISCGCTKVKINKYDLSGKYGIGYTTNTNTIFYFDKEDYETIKDYCWIEGSEGYITTTRRGVDKITRLHRLIMKTNSESEIVDHINHKVYDNRKSNLRVVTKGQNNMNRKLNINNTSGIKGVTWHKAAKAWIATISVNGKIKHLITTENKDEAIAVRKEAEQKYFGEYAYKE